MGRYWKYQASRAQQEGLEALGYQLRSDTSRETYYHPTFNTAVEWIGHPVSGKWLGFRNYLNQGEEPEWSNDPVELGECMIWCWICDTILTANERETQRREPGGAV